MRLPGVLAATLVAVLVTSTFACAPETIRFREDETPWTKQFTLGDFAINSGEVLTSYDGASSAYVSDYVNETDLPDGDFELFSVTAFIPSSRSSTVSVTNVGVIVGRADGTRSPDIFRSSQYVKDMTVGVERYRVYEFTGFMYEKPKVTRTTFGNVVFKCDVAYEHNGRVVSAITRTIEIYGRP